jgi:cystathionine beta-synthase
MMYPSLLHAIGNTPLVRVNLGTPARIYAKLEYLNPGGSIKDRAALSMIEEAERTGLLKPGSTIIEASSGNQGIAAAMIGAIKGYKVIITVSEKNSKEKRDTLRAYGVEVITCPATTALDDPQSYHSTAVRIQKNTPNSFMLNQYYNASNARAHYAMLGPEIWRQTHGQLTHFFAAAGTGGTVSGAGKFLKEQNPAIQVIGVDAATSYRSTQGNPQPYKIEGIGVDFDSPLLDARVIDNFLVATDHDTCAMLSELACTQGLLVGPSSGAVAHTVREYTRNLTPDSLVIMVFGDSGRAYLTKDFYSTNYRAQEQLLQVNSLKSKREVELFEQSEDSVL